MVLQSPAAAPQFLAKVQWRVVGLLDRILPPVEGDDSGIAGLGQLDALKAERCRPREAPSCSTTMVWPRCDRISRMVPRTPMVASLGGDLVGGLVGMAGDEAKRAGGQRGS